MLPLPRANGATSPAGPPQFVLCPQEFSARSIGRRDLDTAHFLAPDGEDMAALVLSLRHNVDPSVLLFQPFSFYSITRRAYHPTNRRSRQYSIQSRIGI